jgi:6-phosphogluconolactonase
VAEQEAGRLTAIGPVPLLLQPPVTSTAAEIETSADGKFVIASIRSKTDPSEAGSEQGNELWVFKRNPDTGKLAFVDRLFCGGRIPRHFKIAPGGKWLLCAHQDSNTISVLPLDPATGKLGAPTCTVPSPSPICILFAR